MVKKSAASSILHSTILHIECPNLKDSRYPPITGLLLIGPFPEKAKISLVREISALQ
jgi:hypothetical protein